LLTTKINNDRDYSLGGAEHIIDDSAVSDEILFDL
jgi:hypothetical protein